MIRRAMEMPGAHAEHAPGGERAGAAGMDAFMCVHRRDVDYLCRAATTSLVERFRALRDLYVVSNDPAHVRDALDSWLPGVKVLVSADSDWLSAAELNLPGWYRQQLIKLRAYEFCRTRAFTNLGADTILLKPVEEADIMAGGEPVLWYRRHRIPNVHWNYERRRVRHIGELLGVEPRRAARHVDFINDFFTFDADTLRRLHQHLCRRHGPSPFTAILDGFKASPNDQRRFGEWTLYSTYVLDVEHASPVLRDMSQGFVEQIHTSRALRRFAYDSHVVHFVRKDLDAAAVFDRAALTRMS